MILLVVHNHCISIQYCMQGTFLHLNNIVLDNLIIKYSTEHTVCEHIRNVTLVCSFQS